MTLSVTAKMKAKKEKIGELRNLLTELVKLTRSETGCLQYDFHESLDDPSLFLSHEKWKDDAAHEKHLASVHVQKALAATPELLVGGLELYRMKKLN